MILKSPSRRLGLALVLAFTGVVGTAHAKNLDSLKQVIAGMEPGMALAEVHLELAEACTDRALYSDALVECEQALELFETFGSDLDRGRGMVKVGEAYAWMGVYDKGVDWIKKGLGVFTSKRDEKGVTYATTMLGMALSQTGEDYLEAKEHLLDALDYHQEHQDVEMLLTTYYSLAMIAADFELDNAKTLRYYYRVIELQREQFSTKEVKDNTLAGAYNNSGLVYLHAEEYPLAIEYMKKALDCLPANGNQQFQAIMNRNLAWLHTKTEEFDVAHHHVNVVEDLASELDFTVLVQFAHDMRCRIALLQGDLDSAAVYKNVAIEYSESNGSEEYDNFTLLGDLSLAQGDMDEAHEHYKRALVMKSDDAEALLGASKCAKAKGDLELALSLRERHHVVEDSLREINKVPAISLSETRQEVNLMEKEERRRVEQEREAAKSRNFLQYSAGLLVIVILLLLLNLVVKLTLPSLVIKAASFITVLTLFEFALVYLDPTIEAASGGQPLAKLGINLLIATVIFPLHTFIEGRIAKAYG